MSVSRKRSLWQKIKQHLIAKISPDIANNSVKSDNLDTVNGNENSNMPEAEIAAKTLACQSETAIAQKTDIKANTVKNHDGKRADSKSIDDENEFIESDTFEPDTFKQNDSDGDNNRDDEFAPNNFNHADETPIVDYLKEYLHDKDWHYTYYRPKSSDSQQSHHLSLRMINKDIDCGYLFRVQENNSLLAIYGILPFLIPDSHLSAAMLLMTQINYDMLIGNLEMDINDGEIRYKNAIDIEAVGIDDHIIEHLLQSVVAMTTVAYEIFSDLVNTENPTPDIQGLLDELRQQVDARTFFLPTQYVQ